MTSHLESRRTRAILGTLVLGILVADVATAQQTPPRFGGGFSELDERRQRLVNDWVARFVKATGQVVEAGPFYDDVISLSTKTTFEAVTHALMTTSLTDPSGTSLGDALALVEQVETVRGEVAGAAGDRQFRMYVSLSAGALQTLSRSQQFQRGADNIVFHKGYPTNFRGQGGAPSVQVSVARDGRRADIDVDYRASGFPVALFNGHLTSSNSDVRAGNNFDRHANRWTGFENWWRGFFGVGLDSGADPTASASPLAIPKVPRAGKKNIDVMVNDFLNAWLVEGNVLAAMGYVSERSYACLARDSDNPSEFDRGVAPFQLMGDLKSAHDALGRHSSLAGLIVGTRFVRPALRVVSQPHHAQFVIYAVPDDVAAALDCENRLTPGDPARARRAYGNYFGATFYVNGRRDYPLALLWARENGYWKVVSWKVGSDDDTAPGPDPVTAPEGVRVSPDPTLVQAVRGFLDSWLVRKDYDAAFGYLSPKAYGCYDLERSQEPPPRDIVGGCRSQAPCESRGVGEVARHGAKPRGHPVGCRALPSGGPRHGPPVRARVQSHEPSERPGRRR